MNLKSVAKQLAAQFSDYPDCPITDQEKEYANQLEQMLRSGMLIKSVDTLESEEKGVLVREMDEDMNSSHNYQSASDSDNDLSFKPSPTFCSISSDVTPLEKMIEVTNACRVTGSKRSKKKWKVSVAKSKFKKIFSGCNSDYAVRNKLKRFESLISIHGSNNEKSRTIDNIVYKKFEEAKANCKIIHDLDLQNWAHEANKSVKYVDFRASRSWVNRFKKKHQIISRKINLNVTTRHAQERKQIEDTANVFVHEVKEEKDATCL